MKTNTLQNSHLFPVGIMVSMVLIFTATALYPGGSQNDALSSGFSWQHNYFCNLFDKNAVNGLPNIGRPLAISGIFFMCLSFITFFYQTATKLGKEYGQKMVKYTGCGGMIIAFFSVSPFHDMAINISNFLCLISILYILVFLFKKKHQILQWLSVFLMVASYITIFIYYSGYYISYLPIMQKLTMVVLIIWALSINYGVKPEKGTQING